ncbi:MAG: amidohydrolase [Actinomycetota bacterium]|nr:amidohydrolase [Actinomycetota bacterium]
MESPSRTSSPVASVLSGLDGIRPWIEDFYRDLHEFPELSHQEAETAAKVAARLEASGVSVHRGVGGTGVVGLLRNGDGPAVLLRADMDALPVAEATGMSYASKRMGTDSAGKEVPVMHACGHDVHVACLLGAAHLLASQREAWAGTVAFVFQPAEETGDGARAMVESGLAGLLPRVDVALAQHVLAAPAGIVGTHSGPTLSAADSMRITVHGRGAHGSMPHASIDPVVLAAMIVVRLQTVVARETLPGEPVVLTVGKVQAGTKSNVIPDHAVIELNIRTYSPRTRSAVLAAIRRIVDGECQASGSPQPATYELFDQFPLTNNDPEATSRVAEAFGAFFGERAVALPAQSASEDFSDIPNALGVPYCYWGIGGTDPGLYRRAEEAGRVAEQVPVNHSALFAPVIQPTLDTGVQALVVAALAWLGEPAAGEADGGRA